MEETRTYGPSLYFIGGLIVTSVALVAAAMAVMKDAWSIPGWKLPLLSFLAWMSVTIFVATIARTVIQWCRSYRAYNANPGNKVEALGEMGGSLAAHSVDLDNGEGADALIASHCRANHASPPIGNSAPRRHVSALARPIRHVEAGGTGMPLTSWGVKSFGHYITPG